MANLREYRDKNGKLKAFYIRVYRGRDADGNQLKPFTMTFDVPETWSEAKARKKAEAQAAIFEQNCLAGLQTDTRQTFQQYAEYVLDLKENNNELKHSTVVRYRELAARIYPEIGQIKLKDLRARHLNALYSKNKNDGALRVTASAKIKLQKVVDDKNLGESASPDLKKLVREGRPLSKTAMAAASGIASSTVGQIFKGANIAKDKADALSAALGYTTEQLFAITRSREPLSDKTVLEHHRCISSVLSVAEKEGLVPFNAAAKASPPRYERPEAEFYEPEVVRAIIHAIESEPIYWQTIGYLIIYTGARRGEIIGLSESGLDFDRSMIHIIGNLLYAADVGKYLDTTKGRKGRYVAVPPAIMEKVRAYIAWKRENGIVANEEWASSDLLFINEAGEPYNPDSVTDWFSKLEERYGLPHIHPHALRHSMASILIFEGVDTTSVAKRLGHASPTTTETIYAHVLQAAEQRNSDIIAKLYG